MIYIGRRTGVLNLPSRTGLDTHSCIHIGRKIVSRLAILREFFDFLRVRKKFWLTPIVLVLVLLSLLIVVTQGSAIAPFIYALF